MTGQQICEAFVRWKMPELTEAAIAEAAERFWNRSPTGELWHVFQAQEELIAAGLIPKPPGWKSTEEQVRDTISAQHFPPRRLPPL